MGNRYQRVTYDPKTGLPKIWNFSTVNGKVPLTDEFLDQVKKPEDMSADVPEDISSSPSGSVVDFDKVAKAQDVLNAESDRLPVEPPPISDNNPDTSAEDFVKGSPLQDLQTMESAVMSTPKRELDRSFSITGALLNPADPGDVQGQAVNRRLIGRAITGEGFVPPEQAIAEGVVPTQEGEGFGAGLARGALKGSIGLATDPMMAAGNLGRAGNIGMAALGLKSAIPQGYEALKSLDEEGLSAKSGEALVQAGIGGALAYGGVKGAYEGAKAGSVVDWGKEFSTPTFERGLSKLEGFLPKVEDPAAASEPIKYGTPSGEVSPEWINWKRQNLVEPEHFNENQPIANLSEQTADLSPMNAEAGSSMIGDWLRKNQLMPKMRSGRIGPDEVSVVNPDKIPGLRPQSEVDAEAMADEAKLDPIESRLKREIAYNEDPQIREIARQKLDAYLKSGRDPRSEIRGDEPFSDESGGLKLFHGTRKKVWDDFVGRHLGTEKSATDRLEQTGIERGEYGYSDKYAADKDLLYELDAEFEKPYDRSVKTAKNIERYKETDPNYVKYVDPEAEHNKGPLTDREVNEMSWNEFKKLADENYDSIPYINDVEDKGSVSHVVLKPEKVKVVDRLPYLEEKVANLEPLDNPVGKKWYSKYEVFDPINGKVIAHFDTEKEASEYAAENNLDYEDKPVYPSVVKEPQELKKYNGAKKKSDSNITDEPSSSSERGSWDTRPKKKLEDLTKGPEEDLPSMMRTPEGRIKMGIDAERHAKAVTDQMYEGNVDKITIKEAIQNAIGAVRGGVGNIKVTVDRPNRETTVEDDGSGMSPHTVENALVDLGGSDWTGPGKLGGFGLGIKSVLVSSDRFNFDTKWKDPDTGKVLQTLFNGNSKDLITQGVDPRDFIVNELPPNTPTGTTINFQTYKYKYGIGNDAKEFLRNMMNDKRLEHNINVTVDGDKIETEPFVKPGKVSLKQVPYGYVPNLETKPIKTLNVDGSDLDIEASTDTHKSNMVKYELLNNGFPQSQGTTWLKGEVNIPRKIIVNVKSHSGPDDPTVPYPWTTDRERVKAPISKAIDHYIQNEMATEAIQRESKGYRDALLNAPKLLTSRNDHKVVDTTKDGIFKDLIRDMVQKEPIMGKFMGVTQKVFDNLKDRLVKFELLHSYSKGNLFGIGFGFDTDTHNDYFGINIPTKGIFDQPASSGKWEIIHDGLRYDTYDSRDAADKASEELLNENPDIISSDLDIRPVAQGITKPINNVILLNPPVHWNKVNDLVSYGVLKPNEAPKQFGREIIATLEHELTHEVARKHNEEFSSELSNNISRLVDEVYNNSKQIEKFFKETPEAVGYFELLTREYKRIGDDAGRSGGDIFSNISSASSERSTDTRTESSSKGGREEGSRPSEDLATLERGQSPEYNTGGDTGERGSLGKGGNKRFITFRGRNVEITPDLAAKFKAVNEELRSRAKAGEDVEALKAEGKKRGFKILQQHLSKGQAPYSDLTKEIEGIAADTGTDVSRPDASFSGMNVKILSKEGDNVKIKFDNGAEMTVKANRLKEAQPVQQQEESINDLPTETGAPPNKPPKPPKPPKTGGQSQPKRVPPDKEALARARRLQAVSPDQDTRSLMGKWTGEDRFYKGWSAKDWLRDILAVPRSSITSGDISAFRNNFYRIATHPDLLLKHFKATFQSIPSRAGYRKAIKDITAPENDAYLKLGLDNNLLMVGERAERTHEAGYSSKIAENIPLYGEVVIKTSERSYAAPINVVRFNTFKSLIDAQGGPENVSQEVAKKTAHYANVITGSYKGRVFPKKGESKGFHSKTEKIIQATSDLAMSSRNTAARLELLNPKFYYDLPNRLKFEAARDVGGTILVGSVALYLAGEALKKMGKKVKIYYHPTDSKFGQIDVDGLTYDIWGGLSQPIKAAAQILTQKMTTDNGTIELGKKYGSPTGGDVFGNFFTNKLAPVPRTVWEGLIKKKNWRGEPMSFKEAAIQDLNPTPMALKGLPEIWDKWPDQFAPAAGLGALGVNVNVPKKKKSPPQLKW